MIMKIVLSEEKAKTNNFSIGGCYAALDRYFKGRDIEKVSEGTYRCDSYSRMAVAQITLPECSWFLKIVDSWHCNYVDDNLDMMEDCLESYYWAEAIYN